MLDTTLNVGEYLKKHDIKPSFQRMRIFEYLLMHPVHPTVDEIYKSLVTEIPTLSKTTVYNTLDLFIEKRIVQMITIEENEARYDADTRMHGHFKCVRCEKVTDFEADFSNLAAHEIEGYRIEQKHVYFRGLCKACLKQELGGIR